MRLVKPFLNGIDTFLAWLSASLKQTTESYCDLETADNENTLVGYDGSLISIIEIIGVTHLIGAEEFDRMHEGIDLAFRANMKRRGHGFQFFFYYDTEGVKTEIGEILNPAKATAEKLGLKLDDLFGERIEHLSKYCGYEKLYLVLWTRPYVLTDEQRKRAEGEQKKAAKEHKMPPLRDAQDLLAGLDAIRNNHEAFVRSIGNDLADLGIDLKLLEVHEAVAAIRQIVDADFTDKDWRPVLPGDKIPVRDLKDSASEISGIMWPSLGKQILPRDAENLDLRTCRIGDKIYSSVFIDLFPQDIKPFIHLFNRVLSTGIPWRMSFFVESEGLANLRFKSIVAAVLAFASEQNRLLSDADSMLRYIEVNTDDAVVKLRVSLSTWAPEGRTNLLRIRASELAKAVEGWGTCEVSEVCGDAFAGAVSSMMGVTTNSVATTSVAPLSDVVFMLPFTRPASPWRAGAVLFRSPDGKPWPYQPGSAKQTTWIDLLFARPGSGKSVLSNTINLALCLSPGLTRLPRIAIIDIGPSSSGLISLIREALPDNQRHLAAYYRLRMTPEFSINPFDTQLGSRYPTPQERTFLVNFLTLLATPVGLERPYDGVSDMVGMVVDEIYKVFSDEGSPRVYTTNLELVVDGLLEEIGFVRDEHTTWWEVTDALFVAGFTHEAMLAQRYAMPLLADAASICRTKSIEDLYGKVIAPTGESLVMAFNRMISGAVREYPILSRITVFDLGDSRVVAFDLDEVAKSGGEAADRQTAVMYMLSRYVLARSYYLTADNVEEMPQQYRSYHTERITEIREDPKRLVYDEFHRTSKAQAVREQVIVDMREGRKWNVQVALISQSFEDFDSVMVEFATSVFVMEAGPEQAIQQVSRVFGLSSTAQTALRTRVHGPRREGATFLAQFATKYGINTQVLTSTIGPIELWAFSTTSEDVNIRNRLYGKLGPAEARRVLANLFPGGSIKSIVEERVSKLKEKLGFIEETTAQSILDELYSEIIETYSKNPNANYLL